MKNKDNHPRTIGERTRAALKRKDEHKETPAQKLSGLQRLLVIYTKKGMDRYIPQLQREIKEAKSEIRAMKGDHSNE